MAVFSPTLQLASQAPPAPSSIDVIAFKLDIFRVEKLCSFCASAALLQKLRIQPVANIALAALILLVLSLYHIIIPSENIRMEYVSSSHFWLAGPACSSSTALFLFYHIYAIVY